MLIRLDFLILYRTLQFCVLKGIFHYTLMMYLVFIFIPTLFNVGFQSYQITKSGTLGFYNSANEISGIISLLTPIMFILLKGKNNLIVKHHMVYRQTPVLESYVTVKNNGVDAVDIRMLASFSLTVRHQQYYLKDYPADLQRLNGHSF